MFLIDSTTVNIKQIHLTIPGSICLISNPAHYLSVNNDVNTLKRSYKQPLFNFIFLT